MSKSTAIVVPTNLINGIICAADTNNNRPILCAFHVFGDVDVMPNGSTVAHLRFCATDSTQMVEIPWDFTFDKNAAIELPEKFAWSVKPTDKLTGASDFIRITLKDDEYSNEFDVRTFKGSDAYIKALANVRPTSYHVWEHVDGNPPTFERLYPKTLTTCSEVSVSAEVFGKIEKALTTAFGKRVVMTFCGAGIDKKNNMGPLEFAVYESGKETRLARAIIMPVKRINHDMMKIGAIEGADPHEVDTLTKALDEMHTLNKDKAEKITALELEIEQYKEAFNVQAAKITQLQEQAKANGDCVPIEKYLEIKAMYDEEHAKIENLANIMAGVFNGSKTDETEQAEQHEDAHEQSAEDEQHDTEEQPVSAPISDAGFYVPDGCTALMPNGVGNVWLEDPNNVTEGHEKEMEEHGWKWAKQRKQWWRKVK